MEKINWGLMGAGRISGWFATGLSVLPQACLYAIGSRDLDKGKAFAQQYGVKKAYGSYEELVNDPEIDVIYIGTPVRYHYECLMLALSAGKNVLCEKVFTLNAAQAREAYDLAKKKNVFLMEAMWTKCQPAYREMKKWIQEGRIGTIQGMELRFFTKALNGHRLFNHEIAGGALLDLGVYPVTVACDLLGYHPKDIITRAVIGKENVDYLNSSLLLYENGSYASVSSGLGLEKMISLFIVGTKGRICIDKEPFFQAQHVEALGYDNQLLGSFDGTFLKNGYEFEAMEVMDCLCSNKKESSLSNIRDTISVLEILDEMRKQWGLNFSDLY